MSNISEKIKDEISKNDVVLYMKGDKIMPCCGFSARVVSILNEMKVDFNAVNVLLDDEIRNGIKKFSDWPTIPQLYVKGKFIGGCDIVNQLYTSGELEKVISS